MYYIYRFTNKTNGKIYIGKTNNVDRRQVEHLSKSKTSNNGHFYNAIRKYGFDSFELDILIECENEEQAYLKETDFIKQHKSNDKNFGYNSTLGGEGLKGISEDTRKKMSENAKLRVGEKNSFFGKQHTELAKQKISEANTGNQYWSGKRHTNEAKQKISEANMGKRVSPETEFKLGQPPTTAKITIELAREIRAKFAEGASRTELQKQYILSKSQISKIINNQCFKENK